MESAWEEQTGIEILKAHFLIDAALKLYAARSDAAEETYVLAELQYTRALKSFRNAPGQQPSSAIRDRMEDLWDALQVLATERYMARR